jgi:large subunit ribosomal protein L13
VDFTPGQSAWGSFLNFPLKISILEGFPECSPAMLLGGPCRMLMSVSMKTFSAKSHEVQHDWFVVDGTNAVLGRLAAEIAHRLRGKHKAEFTPHVDTGDFIVVVNAEKIRVTGNKADDKKYFRHSGYPGGISETTFAKMQDKFPGRALEIAVKGMLPKGPLGYAMIKKLKIYAGESHPHTAQQPKPLALH